MEKVFNVKIATENDIETYYTNRMKSEPENKHLLFQKQKRLHSANNKTAMFFYGYLGGDMICQASAVISEKDLYMQNKEHILKENTAYLFNFLTEEKFRGKGYFSKLYKFAESKLKDMGFKFLALGVEPDDTENIERYKTYGFNTLIYSGTEEFDGMNFDVDYYVKSI